MRQKRSATAKSEHVIAPSNVGPPEELLRHTRPDRKVAGSWLVPAQAKSFVVLHLDGLMQDVWGFEDLEAVRQRGEAPRTQRRVLPRHVAVPGL